MVALTASQRLSLSPGLIAALIVGGAAALVAALLPEWRFQALVVDSGLPALLPAAAPPLGWTARAALIVAAAWIAGGATWWAAGRLMPARGAARPVPRRADAHPDAPLREPVKAMRDLGTPFLEADAPATTQIDERDLPRDLDMPLAAFDPAAIPASPMTPSVPVAPLFRAPEPSASTPEPTIEAAEIPATPPSPETFASLPDEPDPVEDEVSRVIESAPVIEDAAAIEPARIEVFEFTPPVRPAHRPVTEPEIERGIAGAATDATIHALLERLETGVRGAARRGAPAPRDVQDALHSLRRFAAAGVRD